MFCENCGKKSKNGEVFCTGCGKPFASQPQSKNATGSQPTYNGRVKRLTTGWKIVIGVGVLFIILIIIAFIDPSNNSNTSTSDNTTSPPTVAAQIPLPTVPSQIPNYNATSSAAPGDAPAAASSSPTGSAFLSDDFNSYLTAVGEVQCNQGGQPDDTGSGSVWQFAGSSQTYVLTNYHVIQNDDSCTFLINSTPQDSTGGYYDLDISSPMEWNTSTDAAAIPITNIDDSSPSSTPVDQLNYSISSLPLCPIEMPQGAPVEVLGFPASTQNSGPTLTNLPGVISGYDESNPDAYYDYYVTAQVDNGDSGGVVLSKYNNAVCLLGIPTWVSIGEHQVAGDIQDINNIFYTGPSSSQ